MNIKNILWSNIVFHFFEDLKNLVVLKKFISHFLIRALLLNYQFMAPHTIVNEIKPLNVKIENKKKSWH